VKTNYTKNSLIDFENSVADHFNAAKIKAPVHLHHGNEEQLIEIFQDVNEEDWVFSSWRSHYHCLLKGVPPEDLMQEILAGRSISLCFEKYRVVCSGIVTGTVPIALGTSLDIKRRGGKERVWCFMGDMTSETGIAHECIKYARNFDLPITYVIEDNGKSVCTDTRKTWGLESLTNFNKLDKHLRYYSYELNKYPHAGAGKRVQF
jgi:pyruvate dehydrogenase E1 component alpha subunit